ncbi:MAG TPA: DUF4239 domain-containing protein [Thermoanaerobaculia bacterium]|nr:DUF4239 domain-containing protein [Thermoanaerobaculia bacterium]
MSHTVGALLFFGTAFLITLGCLEAGIRMGRRALSGSDAHRPAGLGTVETVAFGVLGLLLAFTFSGAASRFDARRAQVVEEANDVGTAWLRLDLLPPASQPKLRDAFRRYTDSRILMYRKVADLDLDGARAEYARAGAIQNEIWTAAVAACRDAPSQATIVLMPALNAMIDITTTRLAATEMHPPMIVYGVLFVVSFGCALLAGYEMGASAARSWLHVLAYAVGVAFILYVIVDFEYPRIGLIRIDSFDRYLVDVRRAMN